MEADLKQHLEVYDATTSPDVRVREGIETIFQLLGQASDSDAEGVVGMVRDYVQEDGRISQELESLEASRKVALGQRIELSAATSRAERLKETIAQIEQEIQTAIKLSPDEFMKIAQQKADERGAFVQQLEATELICQLAAGAAEQLATIDRRMMILADDVDELIARVPELITAEKMYAQARSTVTAKLGSIALTEVSGGELTTDKTPSTTPEIDDDDPDIPKLSLELPLSVQEAIQGKRSNVTSKQG